MPTLALSAFAFERGDAYDSLAQSAAPDRDACRAGVDGDRHSAAVHAGARHDLPAGRAADLSATRRRSRGGDRRLPANSVAARLLCDLRPSIGKVASVRLFSDEPDQKRL